MTREERRVLRVMQLEWWRASGLTQEAYCRRESISHETFLRWRRKLGALGMSGRLVPQFVPVQVSVDRRGPAPTKPHEPADVLGQPVEVVLSSGRRLRFGGGLDETALARLIRLLEVLPC